MKRVKCLLLVMPLVFLSGGVMHAAHEGPQMMERHYEGDPLTTGPTPASQKNTRHRKRNMEPGKIEATRPMLWPRGTKC